MMFTGSPPDTRGECVRLFYNPGDAQSEIGRGNPIYLVAVHYDALHRRLVSLERSASRQNWSAPASHGADGTVMTRVLIPPPLYLAPEGVPSFSSSPRPG